MKGDVRPNRWESFARRDPEFFVLTGVDGARGRVPEEEFVESGSRAAAEIVDIAQPVSFTRALEIGCGVGRVAIPMARRFNEVVAVDVAPTMLKRLRERATAVGIANIATKNAATTPWCEPASADLIYSLLVFQHIEDDVEIVRLLRTARECATPSAVGFLQFDTRPGGVAYAIRGRVPSFLLPRTWRPGIRRVRRQAKWVTSTLLGAGFEVVAESCPNSAAHVFVVRVAAVPAKR